MSIFSSPAFICGFAFVLFDLLAIAYAAKRFFYSVSAEQGRTPKQLKFLAMFLVANKTLFCFLILYLSLVILKLDGGYFFVGGFTALVLFVAYFVVKYKSISLKKS